MASLDSIFYREFKQMLSQRKAISGVLNIYQLPLPTDVLDNRISMHKKVYIRGIKDEYYSKLNNTEAYLLTRPNLRRRKFDYKGQFIKDANGKFVCEDVTLPNKCVAVVSNVKIGVPLKHKPDDNFDYVDVISKVNANGVHSVKYIYIIPKTYCYSLNQVALVISVNRLRSYYNGVGMALQNGNIIYLFTVPYKPSNVDKSYRIISTKTTLDFNKELSLIKDFWLRNGIIFDPSLCILTDTEDTHGRSNVAYEDLPQVLDSYVRFDIEKSLADVKEDINIDSL